MSKKKKSVVKFRYAPEGVKYFFFFNNNDFCCFFLQKKDFNKKHKANMAKEIL